MPARSLRVHYLITGTEKDLDSDIEKSMGQVLAGFAAKHEASSPAGSDQNALDKLPIQPPLP